MLITLKSIYQFGYGGRNASASGLQVNHQVDHLIKYQLNNKLLFKELV
jgi:hypothetical protein